VKGRFRKDVPDYASRQFGGGLIFLQNDIHLDPDADVLSLLTIHGFLKKDSTSRRTSAAEQQKPQRALRAESG
jgi:hypothetical protein